ncbi:MAG: DUF3298 domain-containing protein [Bacteroides sp.]|nr:DUF3298 domain-containing protein [Bacteroides sp.]
MKRYQWLVNRFLIVLGLLGVTGCDWIGPSNDSPYNHIFREEAAHLTDDASSPFCDFSIDYTYLEDENDSIATLINQAIQREWLGDDYANLLPEVAVDSFMHVYIRDYRQEVGKLYGADRSQATSEEEIPNWYNQTYSLVTFVEEGRGGTVNASANYFVDMGGAHPNQWSRWMNFDFVSGKHLTQEEVFLPSAKADIEKLLLDKLIHQQAEQHPEENVASLEDLQQLGFLQMTNMYIPDNFLLGKEAVLFLFNRYDIAPYSAGEIVIEVPYEEIGPYLKN